MENKKGFEGIFNTLKEKGLMPQYKSYEDYCEKRDKKEKEKMESMEKPNKGNIEI